VKTPLRLLHLGGIQRKRSLDKASDRGSHRNPVFLPIFFLDTTFLDTALGDTVSSIVFIVGCGHFGKKRRELVRERLGSLAIRENFYMKAARRAFLEGAKRNLCAINAL
jgi:hypothetical protein